MRNDPTRFDGLLLRAALVASLFIIVTLLTQTTRFEFPTHGDIWTDLQLINIGQRLADFGPAALRYAWPLDDGHLIGLPPKLYVHWPPTGGLLTAFVFQSGGSEVQARTIMLLVAGLS